METKPRTSTTDNLAWVGGATLIALGAVALVGQFLPFSIGGFIVALFFGGAGLAFFSLAFRSPESWWAMIPGYIFIFVGSIIFLAQFHLPGNVMGVYIMTAIGLPFVYVFLRDRRHWWALIPAYVMFFVAGVIGLSSFIHSGAIIGTYVMLSVAFPFYVVYFYNRKNWWALIPAGIMTFVGLSILLFSFEYILPIALIGFGILLLVIQFRRREDTGAPKLPSTGPDADKPRPLV